MKAQEVTAQEVWEASLANRAESTRYQYLKHFESFSKWSSLSTDELREMKFREDREAKPWERSQVENLVRRYLKAVEEKHLRPHEVNT